MSRPSILVVLVAALVGLGAWLFESTNRSPPESRNPAEPARPVTESTGAASSPPQAAAGLDPGSTSAVTAARGAATTGRGSSGCTIERLETALYGDETIDEALRRRGDQLLPILDRTNDPELLLASNLIDRRFLAFDDAVDRMQRALALAPKNPLVLWHAAVACLSNTSFDFCSAPKLRANMDDVLGYNGAYWSLLAASLHGRGDLEGALEALGRAGSSPDFDVFHGQHILLLERTLAIADDLPYRQRVHEARVIAAGMSGYWEIVQVCAKEAILDDNWRVACSAYADQLVGRGKTIMGKRLGLVLQDRLGSNEIATEVPVTETSLGPGWLEWFVYGEEELRDVGRWLLADDIFAASFVDELVTNGEASAVLRSAEEAVRRRADPAMEPCDFAGVAPR